ncbi:FkbM family methyltransferase [Saccharopolyspora sp. K220]|uniref:FkbM family methyltransferase n=1 Tax=Saccharopolyspora soli TaxID=2926618 RepID=UPI001F579936|nr:FkbM family methyltransferase [Saccharopolyspora soli]MCI2418181.1 FkbM family methyltransferase [Saccharopolyspora soli]
MAMVKSQNSALPGSEIRSRRLAGAAALIRFCSRWSWFVEREIGFLDGFVRPGSVCIDAGASYGSYSLPLAHRVGVTGRVHSVEPIPVSARLLSRFARLCGATNVVVHRAALGRTGGTGHMSQPRRFGVAVSTRSFLTTDSRGRGANAGFPAERLIGTRVTSIDQIRDDHGLTGVDFIKADVEGNELAVLEGARETLAAHHPVLLLEIEQRHVEKYGAKADDVPAWLADYGYTMYVLRRDQWQPAERITGAFRNYLFTTEVDAS